MDFLKNIADSDESGIDLQLYPVTLPDMKSQNLFNVPVYDNNLGIVETIEVQGIQCTAHELREAAIRNAQACFRNETVTWVNIFQKALMDTCKEGKQHALVKINKKMYKKQSELYKAIQWNLHKSGFIWRETENGDDAYDNLLGNKYQWISISFGEPIESFKSLDELIQVLETFGCSYSKDSVSLQDQSSNRARTIQIYDIVFSVTFAIDEFSKMTARITPTEGQRQSGVEHYSNLIFIGLNKVDRFMGCNFRITPKFVVEIFDI